MKKKTGSIFNFNALILLGLIFIGTMIGRFFPVGGVFRGAYIHIGDAFIYLAALFLAPKEAIAVSVIGSVSADILIGGMVYVIPTVIIKTLIVITIKMLIKKTDNTLIQDLLICSTGVITIVGYYIAEVVLHLLDKQTILDALNLSAEMLAFNLLQVIACGAFHLLFADFIRTRVEKSRLKKLAKAEDEQENQTEE